MELKFYNKFTLEGMSDQENYFVNNNGKVYVTLESGVIQRCEDVDWSPNSHFAYKTKKLEKQVEELKESLKCVLFEMDFATDALYAGYGTEDTDEITLARKRAE